MALRSRSSSSILNSKVIAWLWSSIAKLLLVIAGPIRLYVKATGWRSCISSAAVFVEIRNVPARSRPQPR